MSYRISGGASIVDILAIILGAVYSGSSCVSPNVSFDLGKWLLYGGIGSLAASILMLFFGANAKINCFITAAILKICFMIAWFIVGVCLMLTVVMMDVCKQQNYTVYVMSIIYLVYLALSFFGTPIVIVRERENATVNKV